MGISIKSRNIKIYQTHSGLLYKIYITFSDILMKKKIKKSMAFTSLNLDTELPLVGR